MKPTLFVLAAGMGSRYGGLKQLDGLGPNGETIMDYSIFDALRGGFFCDVFAIQVVVNFTFTGRNKSGSLLRNGSRNFLSVIKSFYMVSKSFVDH